MTESDFTKLIVGMTPQQAKEQLPPKYFIFVASENGRGFYRTIEYNPYRINVDVINGKIVKIDSLS